jgi:hypothetical protein
VKTQKSEIEPLSAPKHVKKQVEKVKRKTTKQASFATRDMMSKLVKLDHPERVDNVYQDDEEHSESGSSEEESDSVE